MKFSLIKQVYFPAALITFFFFSITILLRWANSEILLFLPIEKLPMLKTLMVIPYVAFIGFLYFASARISFEKLFTRTLIFLTSSFAFCGIALFFQEPVIGASLFVNWASTLFYLITSLLYSNLFLVFIWGFINQIALVSEGIKSYIPFAFVLMLISGSTQVLQLFYPRFQMTPVVIAIVILLLIAIGIFHWVWKRLPKARVISEKRGVIHKFPYLSSAYLLAVIFIGQTYLSFLYRSHLKAFALDPGLYGQMMARYVMQAGGFTLLFGIVWFFIGMRVMQKKGCGRVLFLGVITICALGAFYLGGKIFGNMHLEDIFIGGLRGTEAILFYPLIQILFLLLAQEKRFQMQILILLLLFPFLRGLGSLAIQGLLILVGNLNALEPYLLGCLLIVFVFLIPASRKLIQTYKEANI